MNAVTSRVEVGQPVRRSSGHLQVENLSKSYEGRAAVCNVNLDIQLGEFFTLLGPSGSGKTTTMMVVAGFVQADTGVVRLDGRRLDDQPVENRDLGIVFQNYALFPHLTVEQNLSFPLEVRKIAKPERKKRIEQSLELIGMSGRENTYPAQLSGGQQQRVALARALIFEPAVLLMDEPLGALDKNMRAYLQVELRQIQRRLGITTIYVTHDQDEAFTMSDRIAVMNQGQIEQIGTPAQIYEDPKTLFVADFVGDNNSFSGIVSDHRCGVTYVDVAGIGQIAAREVQYDVGTRVTLTVRPEHMLSNDEAGVANVLQATVVGVAFTGSMTLYSVEIATGQRCHLRIVNERGSTRYGLGDGMRLRFSSEDVVPFGEDSDPLTP
jgi:putative spermidine/putrescine transport system ATP-binding protein